MNLVMLMAVATGALAQEGSSTGFLLRLRDTEGLLGKEAQVVLTDADGDSIQVKVTDRGDHPDANANDGVLSAAAFGGVEGQLTVAVTAGEERWEGSASLTTDVANPELSLMLTADGGVANWEMQQPEQRLEPLIIANPSGEAVLATTNAGMRGVWLWLVLLGATGLGLGHAWVRLGRRPMGPARLTPEREPGTVPPGRFDASQRQAVLDALAGERRVVVAGPLAHAPAGVIRVEEIAPLPVELVLAIEQLAAQDGPPVAMVVTDPAVLDRPAEQDPCQELARLVDRRFPLWIQDGPDSWPAWPT
jgi:hypothetical protein